MGFQRQYREPNAEWQEVTEEDVRERLGGHWPSIETAIQDLRNGGELWNPFTRYRYREEG